MSDRPIEIEQAVGKVLHAARRLTAMHRSGSGIEEAVVDVMLAVDELDYLADPATWGGSDDER